MVPRSFVSYVETFELSLAKRPAAAPSEFHAQISFLIKL